MEALLKKPVGFPGPLSTPENVGKKNPVHIVEKKKRELLQDLHLLEISQGAPCL